LPSPTTKELKALSFESDERGEKKALPTTKELKVVREMKEKRGGWITIANNKKTLSYERDER
jgi:hypothetical protein